MRASAGHPKPIPLDLDHPTSVDQIAELLGLKPRRLQQLAKEGRIPTPSAGAYRLAPTVKGYMAYLQARAGGRSGTLEEEKVRNLRARSEKAEVELTVIRGKLIDRELAERRVYELATASRDSWLTWPSDDAGGIAADLGVADVGLVRRVLEKWVRARLGRLRDIVVRLVA